MLDPTIPASLNEAKVERLPKTAYYLPNFITEEEETNIIDRIANRPIRDWTELSKRRLQTYPSVLTQNKLIEAPLPAWLQQPVVARLLSIPVIQGSNESSEGPASSVNHIFSGAPHKAPNHCLVNEYNPGQGIMPHEDGPAYHPIVATVSLGSPIILDIFEKQGDSGLRDGPAYRVLQESRSLLITTDSLYVDYLHGIERLDKDAGLSRENIANWDLLGNPEKYLPGSYNRETRISLTYRDVKAVIKASKLLPGVFGKK